jgi:hypothetical protein
MSCYPANKIKYNEGVIVNNILFLREVDSIKYKDGSVVRKGLFRCHCSKEFVSSLPDIFKGKTKSCGCTKGERISKSKLKHGLHNTPEYICWTALKGRCHNTNNIQYEDYGGRGITVCERWDNIKDGFLNFLKDMGKRPSLEYSIDRIDVNGNYEPSNCRWATTYQQANNKRCSVLLTYNDKTKSLTEWSREYDMHRVTLKWRLWKGMTIEAALTTPIDIRFKYKKKTK